ncbi:MAG TPA: mannose-1-phosphate guanyltransferase, partial [Actinomycetes bacterium]|nr:mannose-1-phosphate guanyltransferase [Actinomycetes bacterium]
DLIRFHRERGALVTVCLKRVTNPLEFGITIIDEDGRVDRFLEKPTWGEVFSDTVNTGIYVMEPEIFDFIAAGEIVDWSGDVFPALMAAGRPIYGYVADGYWEDVGTHEAYLRAQADVLSGLVQADIDGFEVAPGIWIAEGAEVDHDAVLKGPLYVGDYAKVEAGAELREYTVLGSNVVVRSSAFLHRAIVHDNVYIGPQTNLRGCVIGKNADVMRAARIDEGAVIGDECLIEEEALVSGGVKVYPFKTIEAGAVVNTSVIWESRGQSSLFGPTGVSGIVNVEITPELAVRLASAYATTLRKGSTVVTARDHSRAARALKRAVIAALTASAIDVRDLECQPLPVLRLESRAVAGGIMIKTTTGVPDSVDISFLDARGTELSQAAQRKLERIYSRQEYRRAFPGEIGDLTFPSRSLENYAQLLLQSIDTTDVTDLRVVIDAGGGAASLVLPMLLGRLGVDAHVVGVGLDEVHPTETAADRAAALERLTSLVASSQASFGVYFGPVGERLAVVDETGRIIDESRALLVFLDLVAAEIRRGRIALPVTTTRVAERVARSYGVDVEWTRTSAGELSRAAEQPGLIFAGDGDGGYVIPEFSGALDGIAAFVRLAGLVARTHLPLSRIDARIPSSNVQRRDVPTPWAAKGMVMRSVVEAAGDRELDTTDGVRIVESDGRWVLVLPDPAQALTHLWAEAPTAHSAAALLDEWTAVVAASHPE